METFFYIIPYFFIGIPLTIFAYLMVQSYLKILKSKNKKELDQLPIENPEVLEPIKVKKPYKRKNKKPTTK
jgi:hypothetical protein